jgi:hypothetical protein
MVGKAEIGCRTGAVDAALVGQQIFELANRQKIDNLFPEILKTTARVLLQRIETKGEIFWREKGIRTHGALNHEAKGF